MSIEFLSEESKAELEKDFKTCAYFPERDLDRTLIPLLRLRNACPAMLHEIRVLRRALEMGVDDLWAGDPSEEDLIALAKLEIDKRDAIAQAKAEIDAEAQ